MSNSRPFSGVTLEILNRMKALGRRTTSFTTPKGSAQHRHPPDPVRRARDRIRARPRQGRADPDLGQEAVAAAGDVLWNGFSQTLDRCRERLPATSV